MLLNTDLRTYMRTGMDLHPWTQTSTFRSVHLYMYMLRSAFTSAQLHPVIHSFINLFIFNNQNVLLLNNGMVQSKNMDNINKYYTLTVLKESKIHIR